MPEPNSVEFEFLPGQGGLDVMRTAIWLDGTFDLTARGEAVGFYENNYPDRPGWREIVVRAESDYDRSPWRI